MPVGEPEALVQTVELAAAELMNSSEVEADQGENETVVRRKIGLAHSCPAPIHRDNINHLELEVRLLLPSLLPVPGKGSE